MLTALLVQRTESSYRALKSGCGKVRRGILTSETLRGIHFDVLAYARIWIWPWQVVALGITVTGKFDDAAQGSRSGEGGNGHYKASTCGDAPRPQQESPRRLEPSGLKKPEGDPISRVGKRARRHASSTPL